MATSKSKTVYEPLRLLEKTPFIEFMGLFLGLRLEIKKDIMGAVGNEILAESTEEKLRYIFEQAFDSRIQNESWIELLELVGLYKTEFVY